MTLYLLHEPNIPNIDCLVWYMVVKQGFSTIKMAFNFKHYLRK